jgi:hypothetical protein
MQIRHPTLLAVALATALAASGAVAHDPHAHGNEEHGHAEHGHEEHGREERGHDHGDAHHSDHEGAHAGVRLLVAASDAPELVVVSATAGDVLGRFTTPGPGHVYTLPNPRVAAVVHRDADRVTFVHSGLTAVDHGEHMDLLQGPPYVLQTVNVGRRPTHVFAHGHDIAIRSQADGSIAWLDARLLGISLDFVEIPGRASDHGSVAVLSDHVLGGSHEAGTVTVYRRDATPVATLEGCPQLHGQAVWGSVAAFGCSDGVLVVEAGAGGVFTAHTVPNPPGVPAGVRVGTLVADADARVIVGDLGAGLALIDPVAMTMTTAVLAAAPAGIGFADHGAALVVLTVDGSLHDLDPVTGAVRRSIEVAHPAEGGAPRPALAVLGAHAFVTDPGHGDLVVVDLHEMAVQSRFDLPFTPGSVAVMAIPGAVVH